MEFRKSGKSFLTVRRHRAFLLVCLAVVISFVAAMLYMNYKVQTTVTPPASDIVMLHNGDVFRQEIVHKGGDLRQLHITFTDERERAEGELTVSLYAGEALVQEWVRPAKAIDNTEVYFITEKTNVTADTACHVEVRADFTNANGVGIRTTVQEGYGPATYNGGVLNGQAAVYALVYVGFSATMINIFHIGMYALFALILIATAYVLLYTKIRAEVLFTVLVFIFSMAFAVSMTPTSPPDEPHHYHSAYQLSNYLLFRGDTAEYGYSNDFDYHAFVGHANVSDAYLRVFSEFGEASPAGGAQVVIPSPRKLTYFVQYLPQATGMAISRALGRNMVTTFMLGRFCNLLFYTACVYVSLKRMSVFKVPMGIVAMLPMTLHQAASLSYDGFVNGMALLLVSAIVNLLLTKDKVSLRELVFIGVVSALLAPAKVIYCPVLLLLFLVRKERFGSMKRKLISIGCILLLCAVMIMLIQLPTMMEMTSRGDTKLNYENEFNYTPKYILQHPLESVGIFLKTFYENFYGWFQQAIGSLLSGMSIVVWPWVPTAYMFVLLFAVINNPKEKMALNVRDRFALVFVILMIIALVMASMFVGWTSNDSKVIQGVQGRYFIPLLPLIILAVANNNFTLKKNIDRELVFTSTALCVTTLASVLEYTMLR